MPKTDEEYRWEPAMDPREKDFALPPVSAGCEVEVSVGGQTAVTSMLVTFGDYDRMCRCALVPK